MCSAGLFRGALDSRLTPPFPPVLPSLQEAPAPFSHCLPLWLVYPSLPHPGAPRLADQISHRKACFPPPSTAPLSSSPPLTQRTISQFGELSQTWVGDQLPEKRTAGRGGTGQGLRLLPHRAPPLPPLHPTSTSHLSPNLKGRPSPWAWPHPHVPTVPFRPLFSGPSGLRPLAQIPPGTVMSVE